MAANFYNTRLGQLEGMFNRQFDGWRGFYFSKLKPQALGRWLNGTGKGDDADTGITVHGFTLDDDRHPVQTKSSPVTFGELKSYFDKASAFNGKYYTFDDLIRELKTAATDNAPARQEIVARNVEMQTEATRIMRGTNEGVAEFQPIPLFTNARASLHEVTAADEAFTMQHLHRDANEQLYWRFDDNTEYPLPLVEKDGKFVIGADLVFWNRFFNDNARRLSDWVSAIYTYIDAFTTDAIDVESFEAGLLDRVPTFILASLAIGKRIMQDPETGKRYCAGYEVRLRSGSSTTATKDRGSWQDILKSTMVNRVPAELLHKIVVFSNDTTAAVHRLPPIPVRTEVPTAHPLPKDYGCFHWQRFLRSTGGRGNTKFPSQRMGELRLAKAIFGVCCAADYSRQILCAFGEGQDGKSVCFEAIATALDAGQRGSLCATGLAQRNFEDQFGLWQVVNKRLLVVDDIPRPYDFIECDTVKRISGAGLSTLQVDRKNLRQFAWQPSGAKLIMSTNNPITLRNEATISRCLPLFFTRNYLLREQADPVELTTALASEVLGDGGECLGMLAWAIDVLIYYHELRNVRGERCPVLSGDKPFKPDAPYPFTSSSVMVLSDAMLDAWQAGELDLLADDVSFRGLRQRAYTDETISPERATAFASISQDTGDECGEVRVIFEKTARMLLAEDSCGFVSSSDLAETLVNVLRCNDFRESAARSYLQACGFEDRPVRSLVSSVAYKQLCQTVLQVFAAENTVKRVGTKTARGFAGVSLRPVVDIQTIRPDCIPND